MTAEGREIVVVSIKDGSKTILDWFGFECGTEQNFCQLFEALFIASQNDTDNNRFKYAIDHDIGSAPGKADPVPTEDGDHFKSFEELYGTETTEKFRPSLVSKQTTLAQRDFGFRLSGETVRRTILCTECSKPRCVYSPKKLVEAERQSLEQILDTIDYTCGTSAIPESHKLHKVCLFENVTCGNSITPHYYSSRLKFPLVCHVCVTPDDLVPIQDDWKESYQSIHPVCHQCKSIGHEERTRNKSKVGGKKKK